MGRLKPEQFSLLRCPACKQELHLGGEDQLICVGVTCRREYPIIAGVPILINEDTSVFSLRDYLEQKETTYRHSGKLKSFIGRLLPRTGTNLKARRNFEKLESLLLHDIEKPSVLIVGSGDTGAGLDAIIRNSQIDFVHSDVAMRPQTELICDAHDLPFDDESFDGVIVQAVLEHVVDPHRCVGEIHRTLKGRGIVYAEVPFLQAVHGGRYDFTRFTDLGLRRLCRRFEEIERGAMCGSGMALAGVYIAFLKSLAWSREVRNALVILGTVSSFWLKYFDYNSIDTPGSLDAASGLYFMGRKCSTALSDRDLTQSYRGASGL